MAPARPAAVVHDPLERVEVTGECTSYWVASAPAGRSVQWDAQLTQDTPGRKLEWPSLPGSDVTNDGTVTFTPAPAGRGTEVTVRLNYRLPAGHLGATVAKLFGEDRPQQLDDDLHVVDRHVPTMRRGDVLGPEFIGEVGEVGPGIADDRLRVGDRVFVLFPIARGDDVACRYRIFKQEQDRCEKVALTP